MTTATLQLAAAAHGTGEHRHPAQSRIQHCIQPCASSLCATPAMPSTMLNHVDKSSLHPLSGLQRVTSGAADGQPDLGLTPDQAQCTRHDSPHTTMHACVSVPVPYLPSTRNGGAGRRGGLTGPARTHRSRYPTTGARARSRRASGGRHHAHGSLTSRSCSALTAAHRP